MQDNTDHNRLAAQFAERLRNDAAFVDQRVAEINAFEARARGDGCLRKPKRTRVTPVSSPVSPAPTAAPVATQGATSAMSSMSLFQPAQTTTAHLKAGFMGKQGAGKSATAALLAIGLVKFLRQLGIDYAEKPVAFFDTETGSDWLIPIFKEAGIALVVAKKRSFSDLIEAVKWSEENACVLIIDSITHPWRELQESYLKAKKRSFLQIDDWAYLKGPQGWAQFSDLYINTKLHIIMCGRAGDETEQYTDENGKRQFEKVGVKMKTETETGFEPSLLVLMERDMNLRTNQVAHSASVVKDRSMLLDGKDFTFHSHDGEGNRLPTDVLVRSVWVAFEPHIKMLNLGGSHLGVQSMGDSTHMIKAEKRDNQHVQREICVDEIKTLLELHFPSQSADDKKKRLKLLLKHFDATWTEIEKVMPLGDLRTNYDSLYQELEGKPSKYGSAIAKDAAPAEINDSLPTFADLDDSLPEPAAAAA